MTLAERIRQAFDPAVHTQSQLARAARVRQPSVADWFSGKTTSLKAEPLVRAALYLNVVPLWLATGEGPMRPPEWRPPWPFASIDEPHLARCTPEQLARIEAGLLAVLAALGLDPQVTNAAAA